MQDPLVERVVRRIAEAIGPEKMILFGSNIHRLFEHPEFSMDVFVLTPEELESQRRIANTLAREVSEHGLVCYG